MRLCPTWHRTVLCIWCRLTLSDTKLCSCVIVMASVWFSLSYCCLLIFIEIFHAVSPWGGTEPSSPYLTPPAIHRRFQLNWLGKNYTPPWLYLYSFGKHRLWKSSNGNNQLINQLVDKWQINRPYRFAELMLFLEWKGNGRQVLLKTI